MASVNKVIIIGRLGADPELKYTPNGNRAVCSLRIATNEAWKDKAGQKQESVEWHRVTIWGDQAEHCNKYLEKGREVYVEGRLKTRTWDDKDGAKRSATDIVADRVQFLGGGKDQGPRQQNNQQPEQKPGASWDDVGGGSIGDDDIPF